MNVKLSLNTYVIEAQVKLKRIKQIIKNIIIISINSRSLLYIYVSLFKDKLGKY